MQVNTPDMPAEVSATSMIASVQMVQLCEDPQVPPDLEREERGEEEARSSRASSSARETDSESFRNCSVLILTGDESTARHAMLGAGKASREEEDDDDASRGLELGVLRLLALFDSNVVL